MGRRVSVVAAGFYHSIFLTGGEDDTDEHVEEESNSLSKTIYEYTSKIINEQVIQIQ